MWIYFLLVFTKSLSEFDPVSFTYVLPRSPLKNKAVHLGDIRWRNLNTLKHLSSMAHCCEEISTDRVRGGKSVRLHTSYRKASTAIIETVRIIEDKRGA